MRDLQALIRVRDAGAIGEWFTSGSYRVRQCAGRDVAFFAVCEGEWSLWSPEPPYRRVAVGLGREIECDVALAALRAPAIGLDEIESRAIALGCPADRKIESAVEGHLYWWRSPSGYAWLSLDEGGICLLLTDRLGQCTCRELSEADIDDAIREAWAFARIESSKIPSS